MANAPLVVPLLDGTTVAMTVDEAKAALATKGLHVVTAADKAVLDAMASAWIEGGKFHNRLDKRAVCLAELARREAAK